MDSSTKNQNQSFENKLKTSPEKQSFDNEGRSSNLSDWAKSFREMEGRKQESTAFSKNARIYSGSSQYSQSTDFNSHSA